MVPQNGHRLKLVPDLSSGKESLSVWGANFTQHLPSFVARGEKPHCWALAPLWSSARSSTPVAFKVSVTANLIIDIVCVLVAQLCPTSCDPMGCSLPAPLYMEFSRQEHWSGLSFPSSGDLEPGIEPRSPAFQADSLPSEPPGSRTQNTSEVCLGTKIN